MNKDNDNNEDIEIIFWGDEETENIVNSESFSKSKRRRKAPENIDWKKEIKGWIKLVIVAVIIALVINKFVIINASVPTGSMEQTIKKHSRMMGFRLAYLFSKPERGDIIIFKYPDDESQNYVKRVIGLPGEYVEVKAGVVYINDEPLDEDYVYFDNGKANSAGDFDKTLVPDDSYFVLGDNRNDSRDSRFWETTNFVAEDKILGKAIFSYYPDLYWFD